MEDKDIKVIYTITTMSLEEIEYPIKENGKETGEISRYLATKRTRTPGWYSCLADAMYVVENNCLDIYEVGHYPIVVIEQVTEGLYNVDIESECWYEWSGDCETGSYKSCEKPKGFKNIGHFGMG